MKTKPRKRRKVWPVTTPERRKIAHALRNARYCWGKYATRAQKIEGAHLSIKWNEAVGQFVDLKIKLENFMSEKLDALARAKPNAARLSLIINGDELEMTRRMLAVDDAMDELSDKLHALEDQVRVKRERTEVKPAWAA